MIMTKLIPLIIALTFSGIAWGQAPQAKPGEGTIALANNWSTPMQGGSASTKDLATLLSPFFQAKPTFTGSKSQVIFEGVTYLMPLEEAKRALNLTRSAPKNTVATGGFPKDSFFHYAFDGTFEGHYNKLYLVTDRADQVVCVQLVSETPERSWISAPTGETGWHTYNFISSRTKALSRLWVDHKVGFLEGKNWRTYMAKYAHTAPTSTPEIIRVDSCVIDPIKRNGFRDVEWRALEASRWYIPRPLGELLLQCSSR